MLKLPATSIECLHHEFCVLVCRAGHDHGLALECSRVEIDDVTHDLRAAQDLGLRLDVEVVTVARHVLGVQLRDHEQRLGDVALLDRLGLADSLDHICIQMCKRSQAAVIQRRGQADPQRPGEKPIDRFPGVRERVLHFVGNDLIRIDALGQHWQQVD